jgi:hypothetical protein
MAESDASEFLPIRRRLIKFVLALNDCMTRSSTPTKIFAMDMGKEDGKEKATSRNCFTALSYSISGNEIIL